MVPFDMPHTTCVMFHIVFLKVAGCGLLAMAVVLAVAVVAVIVCLYVLFIFERLAEGPPSPSPATPP